MSESHRVELTKHLLDERAERIARLALGRRLERVGVEDQHVFEREAPVVVRLLLKRRALNARRAQQLQPTTCEAQRHRNCSNAEPQCNHANSKHATDMRSSHSAVVGTSRCKRATHIELT